MKEITSSKRGLEKLSSADQELFQKFGFGTKVDLPFECIHHAIEHQVSIQPNAIAIDHLGQTITYQELDLHAERLAALLSAHGIEKGDRIGLFVKRSIPMVVGILASLKLGAVYVPQDVGVSSESRLKYIIDTADIKVSLTLSKFKTKIPKKNGDICIAIDEVMNRQVIFDSDLIHNKEDRAAIDRTDKCFVLFTSGTTGKPNGVQVTHENLCNILLLEPGNLSIEPGWKVGQILNIAFDMAAWEILGCLSHGGTLLIRGKDIGATLQHVDVIIATPSILSVIDPNACPSIKKVAVAGEPCPLTLANKWSQVCDFYNCCGPTETTIVNTMQLCTPNAQHITIGTPTPNNTVYILDDNQEPVPIGGIGMMWAGGHCVTAGYINNDQLNQERYAVDPFLGEGQMMFRTGDLGRWTKEGQLEHHGRQDDQVKVRGFRVELDGISAVIETMPECRRAVSLKLDDRNLVSFVMPADVDIDRIKAKIAAELPYYYSPSFILAMDQLPMTARGKIDKRLLLQKALLYQNGATVSVSSIPNLENTSEDGQKKRA